MQGPGNPCKATGSLLRVSLFSSWDPTPSFPTHWRSVSSFLWDDVQLDHSVFLFALAPWASYFLDNDNVVNTDVLQAASSFILLLLQPGIS